VHPTARRAAGAKNTVGLEVLWKGKHLTKKTAVVPQRHTLPTEYDLMRKGERDIEYCEQLNHHQAYKECIHLLNAELAVADLGIAGNGPCAFGHFDRAEGPVNTREEMAYII